MKKAHIIVGLIILAAAVAGLVWRQIRINKAPGAFDNFARCLAEQGVTMYGAAWCGHCQNQKKAFGNSFRLVPYVECPAQPETCLALDIKGYPTWIFKNGKRLEGETALAQLAEASGCVLTK